jgi:hypothetical protein
VPDVALHLSRAEIDALTESGRRELAPTSWYVAACQSGQFNDAILIRVECEQFYDELGRLIEKPENTRFLGLIQHP